MGIFPCQRWFTNILYVFHCRTPNTNNTTKKSSKVQLDVIPVQNSANIVSGIRVLPPETVHNNSIYVSEIAVMSFAPQSHCVLESLNFGQSLKDVFPGTIHVKVLCSKWDLVH